MAHGHDDAHHDHGHSAGSHPEPEPPATPPAPHVFTIARLTRGLGMLLVPAGIALAVYSDRFASNPSCGCVAAWSFAAFYGFCLWRSSADTLDARLEGHH